MSEVYSIKPEEVVSNYNLAIDDRNKAIKLDRDNSYSNIHNEATDDVADAQRIAELYAQEYSLELQTMARAQAEEELRTQGKALNVPDAGTFETATNVRLIDDEITS